jgi:hypothetical protein
MLICPGGYHNLGWDIDWLRKQGMLKASAKE